MELKTDYFSFDWLLQNRFLCSISSKRLTVEVSALGELNVLFHAPLVSSLCDLTSQHFHRNWLSSTVKTHGRPLSYHYENKTKTINNLRRINWNTRLINGGNKSRHVPVKDIRELWPINNCKKTKYSAILKKSIKDRSLFIAWGMAEDLGLRGEIYQ